MYGYSPTPLYGYYSTPLYGRADALLILFAFKRFLGFLFHSPLCIQQFLKKAYVPTGFLALELGLFLSCARAILLTSEKLRAAFRFFRWLSSLKVTSSCQCRLFSMLQCVRMASMIRSGSKGREVM